ncbi:hypothetical protein Nepgr_001085 [Nepenthes gracilis]|uniref:Uncharacterized protein n=1 Tax=Nepenthes gracilis TaxID=150966 RepID=A0AAD3P3T4_NEPGR|nr:hypothetical protein Nepgr_001085 [Nepenthes gracilis]
MRATSLSLPFSRGRRLLPLDVVSTIIRDIVEVFPVMNHDVPAEFMPSVDTEVEVEAAIEPSPEAPAELPDVSVQAVQSESLAEEVVGAQDFGVVEEGTVFIDVESPGAVPCAGALSSEMEAQVPVAPARDSHVPELCKRQLLVTKGFSQIEALGPLSIQRSETELVEAGERYGGFVKLQELKVFRRQALLLGGTDDLYGLRDPSPSPNENGSLVSAGTSRSRELQKTSSTGELISI